ncbi:hypothetical protein ACM66B_007058 [Microbotryomycetes sp. NB124-2]
MDGRRQRTWARSPLRPLFHLTTHPFLLFVQSSSTIQRRTRLKAIDLLPPNESVHVKMRIPLRTRLETKMAFIVGFLLCKYWHWVVKWDLIRTLERWARDDRQGMSGGVKDVVKTLVDVAQRLQRCQEPQNQVAGHEARLRRNNSLSEQEETFLEHRLQRIKESAELRSVLRLPREEQIDIRDVPVIGLGGSGGGMRANLALLSTVVAMQDVKFWPLVTYLAGVSGSCWAIASMYTLSPNRDGFRRIDARLLLRHFQAVSESHPLSTKGLLKLSKAKNGLEAVFEPLIKKRISGQTVCLMDLYATLVTSFFWTTPGRDGGLILKRKALEWTPAYDHVKDGSAPFPMLTAVRHERPWRTCHTLRGETCIGPLKRSHNEAWWQWFEINPVEAGSAELEGWIPTSTFGSRFQDGESTNLADEQSLGLFLGCTTAAPAAPLSTILGGVWKRLPNNWFGRTAKIWIRRVSYLIGESLMDKLDSLNPVHAAADHNPFHGASQERGRGNAIETQQSLQLVDSGMSNNLPIAPFLHPARDVDIILLLDASSDVQRDAALSRIKQYCATAGLKVTTRKELPRISDDAERATFEKAAFDAQEIRIKFAGRYAQVLRAVPVHSRPGQEALVYNCRHQPQSWKPVTIIYLPLLPNAKNPKFDPSKARFSSTHNLVWKAEQVETLSRTAQANMHDSIDVVREVVRQVWLQKKKERLAAESATDEANCGPQAAVARARRNVFNSSDKVFVKDRTIEHSGQDRPRLNGMRPWMTDW